ncbi:MAG TPA: phytoene/squalene synthase family protein [Nitrospiria bacterium]|nr:phytoene/squalene synthase family protein [Nitrospiria bacterium]
MKPDLPQDILKGVSRSFYLTLRVLPAEVRPQIGMAYLFCRTADTIADSALIPRAERQKILDIFRNQFKGNTVSFEALGGISNAAAPDSKASDEKKLLDSLPECFKVYLGFSRGDRERIQNLVTILSSGMETDLKRFSGGSQRIPVALRDENELDQYCYHVAGIVGEFWTQMAIAHFPSLKNWNEKELTRAGVHFGKGLQMTNILKDLSKDLSRGRCYLPHTVLDKHGLKPADLVPSLPAARIRPLLSHVIHLALGHLEEGWKYIMRIPRAEFRLRLACLWPHLFALKTLTEILGSSLILEPSHTVKISRASIYNTIIRTGLFYYSNGTLTRYYENLRRRLILATGTA